MSDTDSASYISKTVVGRTTLKPQNIIVGSRSDAETLNDVYNASGKVGSLKYKRIVSSAAA